MLCINSSYTSGSVLNYTWCKLKAAQLRLKELKQKVELLHLGERGFHSLSAEKKTADMKKKEKFFREREQNPNFLHVIRSIGDTMLSYSVCTETGRCDPSSAEIKGG